jgi:hypothetical protein
MKTILAVMAIAAGVGAAKCGEEGVSKKKCEVAVAVDTMHVFASADADSVVVLTASSDTVRKPYLTCVTVYASASDTVHHP